MITICYKWVDVKKGVRVLSGKVLTYKSNFTNIDKLLRAKTAKTSLREFEFEKFDFLFVKIDKPPKFQLRLYFLLPWL